MKKDNIIHINAGKYKGRKIFLPNIETTRPSKSIVRNSIFNTLQNEVTDRPFIELFAGSGSIGFEAVSRGSSKVLFCEMNRVAIQTLKKNILSFSGENIEIITGDTFSNISTILSRLDKESIFYLDPPFSIRDGMEDIYKKSYKIFESIDKKYIYYIILEHLSDEVAPKNIGETSLIKSKKFGKTTISYYKFLEDEI